MQHALPMHICISNTQDAFACFKVCFAICIKKKTKSLFVVKSVVKPAGDSAAGAEAHGSSLQLVTALLAARHPVQLSLCPAGGTVRPLCSPLRQGAAAFRVSFSSASGRSCRHAAARSWALSAAPDGCKDQRRALSLGHPVHPCWSPTALLRKHQPVGQEGFVCVSEQQP